MSLVKAKNLIVKKNNSIILDDLTFAVQPGKITGLIGPSGSGKTTLMRTIVGSQAVTSGTLTIGEILAGDASLRTKVGYVTQAAAVYDDLTVWQNICYFATLVSAEKGQAEGVLKTVDLERQRGQLARTLSGGQKARVSLAVVLLGEYDVLILDEPTVGLDPLLRQKLWKLFRELAASGKALLISSHVMDEADRCDDVLLLRDGELLWHESRKALLKSTGTPSVGEAFLKMVEAA